MFVLLAIFVIACGLGLLSVAWVQQRTKRSQQKRTLATLQTKLIETPSDACKLLQDLVDGNTALERNMIADFYSSKLVALRALPEEQRKDQPVEPMWSTDCWLSRPEYHRSPKYYQLGESFGSLLMDSKQLRFVNEKVHFNIDLADVRQAETTHHPQWLRPLHLLYLSVQYMEKGNERTVYLSPVSAELDGLDEMNRQVTEWKARIIDGRDKRVAGRFDEFCLQRCQRSFLL
jgi:hypothetical protein